MLVFSNYEHTLAFAEWYRGCRLTALQGETRMADIISSSQISSAFVTGATGLLGNNLVRLLVARGVRVRALVRSREKAERQFDRLPVEVVTGDMNNVAAFAEKLRGGEVLFHTAAYFRDSFKGGGKHWKELHAT